MGRSDYYAEGEWNAMCAECGRKRKSSEMRKLPPGDPGAGLWVCYPEHWQARHPQDFVKGVPDETAPPWVQPMPPDTFADFCTPNGLSAVPGFAMPGCMVPGYLSPAFNLEGDPE